MNNVEPPTGYMPGKQVNRTVLLQILLLGGAVAFTFSGVWYSLWQTWVGSDDYAHGLLIPPVALYIAWRTQAELPGRPLTPSRMGGWLLPVFCLGYVLARFAENATLSAVFMVLTFGALILFVAGWQTMRTLLFPLLLLFFMIPVPEQVYASVTVPLQLFVSKVSVDFAQWLDIPIYRNGNIIQMSSRTLEVVQACSGLRSLMSLVTLSLIMGYFLLNRNILRTLLVILSLPMAVLVNCFRVLAAILVLHFFQYDLTDDSVHTLFGAAMFGAALGLLYMLQRGLALWDR
ncbi:exosortase/archaeosortase family protein [Desulfobulbus oligotrophicus]|uniref:Exosortase/archaeosortase family protein n=1 Tax=Desulfobulbus oligotrophicus TaxID=1909699 RepID=A0A7T6APH6_9BACT|nr:exosortase/archaeosortase family protein [Desulfobulbus oligotrophicus]QQG64716.1 exosortase/archaeosortase family protein [Desulfobulbus oligotrophicus]